MRNYKSPTKLAKSLAIASKAQGIDLIYFNHSGVDIKSKKIHGKIYINNKWNDITTDIPKLVDVSQFCFKKKYKEIMDYLVKVTKLSDNNTGKINKMKLQRELKKDKSFSDLVIPTQKVKSFQTIEDIINKYNVIVLKPLGGSFGDNIYMCEKTSGEMYKVTYENIESEFNASDFKSFYIQKIKDKKYIIQKYIDSTTIQGHPFDCRINMEKDSNGNWVLAKNFIRIGIGQKTVSNISKGGGVSSTKPFLEANFKSKRKSIEKKLNFIAETLPQKVEFLKGFNLMILGIDVGIDKNGDVYIFEINGSPGTSQLNYEAALYRSQYYKYVLEHELNMKTNGYISDFTAKELQNYINKQVEQNAFFKNKCELVSKELNKVYDSTSWKITKPLRYIGNVLKRKK